MSDEWDDYEEEDYVDDYELEALDELGSCPECRAEMLVDAEVCPRCGHWLSTAERHALWSGGSNSLLSVGKIVLVFVLVALFVGSLFGML